jgi:hypothetical protein
MAALDGMVLEHLADKLFTPERLRVILKAYIEQSAEADTHRREQLQQARRGLTEAQAKITRLLELVEQGVVEANDPDLKGRFEMAKQARKDADERVRLLQAAGSRQSGTITEQTIARFASALRQALQDGDPTFRKAYLRLFVDQVVVGDTEIRLRGPTAALAKAASRDSLPSAGELVPSFVQDWRPRRDSNSRPQD